MLNRSEINVNTSLGPSKNLVDSTSECKEHACTNLLHRENDSETHRYDDIYEFCNSHFALHHLVVPSTSYHESDIFNAPNDDLCEPCDVDICHKQYDLSFHPLGMEIDDTLDKDWRASIE